MRYGLCLHPTLTGLAAAWMVGLAVSGSLSIQLHGRGWRIISSHSREDISGFDLFFKNIVIFSYILINQHNFKLYVIPSVSTGTIHLTLA
jgi:hypothetical protein